jgi:hypothetical protein
MNYYKMIFFKNKRLQDSSWTENQDLLLLMIGFQGKYKNKKANLFYI